MISPFRNTAFKFLLLTILCLKVGVYVNESVSSIIQLETISELVDIDINEEENQEQEDEFLKIYYSIQNIFISNQELFRQKKYSYYLSSQNLYFEFVTPPPEVIL